MAEEKRVLLRMLAGTYWHVDYVNRKLPSKFVMDHGASGPVEPNLPVA